MKQGIKIFTSFLCQLIRVLWSNAHVFIPLNKMAEPGKNIVISQTLFMPNFSLHHVLRSFGVRLPSHLFMSSIFFPIIFPPLLFTIFSLFKQLQGPSLSYSHFIVFGCACFILLYSRKHTKLESCACLCCFLGCGTKHKGF